MTKLGIFDRLIRFGRKENGTFNPHLSDKYYPNEYLKESKDVKKKNVNCPDFRYGTVH